MRCVILWFAVVLITRPLIGVGQNELTATEERTWRSRSGATVQARLVEDRGSVIILQPSDGKRLQIAFVNLSQTDQNFLRAERERRTRAPRDKTRAASGTASSHTPALSVDYLSSEELAVIQEINLARTNPSGYAKYLKSFRGEREANGVSPAEEAIAFLLETKPRRALAPSKTLAQAARDHVADTGPKGVRGHAGSDGSQPFDRVRRHDPGIRGVGENISYGVSGARAIVVQLIIDKDVPSRGHRHNIFSDAWAQAGVAIGPHKEYRRMCVIDFGS